MEDFAKIAYEAYVKECGGKSLEGMPYPAWDALSPQMRWPWDAAAQAVLAAERSGR